MEKMNSEIQVIARIEKKIHIIPPRPPFMIDKDVAEIYGVKVKRLNQQARRNPDRFPKEIFFRLTDAEVAKCNLEWSGGHQPYGYAREASNMAATVLKTSIASLRAQQIVKAFTHLEEMRIEEALKMAIMGDSQDSMRPISQPQPVNALPSVRVVACEDTLVRLFRWPGLEGECITGLDFTRALGYANSNSISRPPYNASMYEGHERILKGEELKRFRSLASTVGYHISPNQSLRLVDMVYARRVALFGRSKRSLRFLQWCEELQTGLIANMVPGRGGLPVQGSFQLHA